MMAFHRQRISNIFVFSLVLCLFLSVRLSAQDFQQLDSFKDGERVLILAPHPDDEAIACAGVIQEAILKGAKVKIVYLTNGEHNQFAFIVYKKRIVLKKNEFIALGQLRRKESIEAMQLLGLKEDDLIFLGYPDFGTFSMFTRFWNTDKPFRSLLTRISHVPYADSPSFKAPYLGENILKDLKKVILAYRPDKIFVSHSADVNVDHKSLYLFLQIALAQLKEEIAYPKIYPYLVHHSGWPLPRHYHPDLKLTPPKSFSDSDIKWLSFDLTAQQLDNKKKAILCYRSQTQSSAFYLLAFARKNELFGDYSAINLNHQAKLNEKPISFFGSSRMFPDINLEGNYAENIYLASKGRVSYAVLEDDLIIMIEKPEDIVYRFSTIVYLFGYNYSVPFANMPKMRIITKHKNFRVLDGKRLINASGIYLNLVPKALTLKIPLKELGSPDFILASVRSYIGRDEGGDSPIYATGFRRININ
ncbi:MAG: PIG-L family deacetylase [Candidatus Omnitrophica bacterium]|nr:PIG-L family deacetylase [Candidatus Omnitrophota bacterium]